MHAFESQHSGRSVSVDETGESSETVAVVGAVEVDSAVAVSEIAEEDEIVSLVGIFDLFEF